MRQIPIQLTATALLCLSLLLPVQAKPFRQVEQVRQQQRSLPGEGISTLIVDGWGPVTVRGGANSLITATATLRAWAGSVDEAEKVLQSLRWYLDPAGGGAVRVGASGPSQAGTVRYRGQRYGNQAQVALVLTVPAGLAVRVTTADGDVGLTHVGATEVRVDKGTVSASHVTGTLQIDTKAGGVRVSEVTGRTWLNAGSGSITASGVNGDLRATSGGGALAISGITGRAELTTKNGRIRAVDVGGELQATTTTGTIHAEAVHGPVTLRTVYGRITGRQLSGPAVALRTKAGAIQLDQTGVLRTHYDLRTDQGPIEVRLSPEAALDIEAVSATGRVETSLPVTTADGRNRSRLAGTLNGGGYRLRVRSENGVISLLPAAP